LTFKILLQ